MTNDEYRAVLDDPGLTLMGGNSEGMTFFALKGYDWTGCPASIRQKVMDIAYNRAVDLRKRGISGARLVMGDPLRQEGWPVWVKL